MCKAVVQKDIIRSSDGDTPSAHWFFFAPRTMQIADFIIGLLGHLWLRLHHVWLLISFLTKKAACEKEFCAQLKVWRGCSWIIRSTDESWMQTMWAKQDHESRNGYNKVKINSHFRKDQVPCELIVDAHCVAVINLPTFCCKITPQLHDLLKERYFSYHTIQTTKKISTWL